MGHRQAIKTNSYVGRADRLLLQSCAPAELLSFQPSVHEEGFEPSVSIPGTTWNPSEMDSFMRFSAGAPGYRETCPVQLHQINQKKNGPIGRVQTLAFQQF